MAAKPPTPSHRSTDSKTETHDARLVSEECIVVRNHDGVDGYTVAVRFTTPDDTVAYDREFTVGPLETIVVETRLPRSVYRVDARLEDGQHTTAECLLGSGPHETALVEMGNGIVSVVEGFR